MVRKVCLRCKGKKVCWHHPAIFCLITWSKLSANNLNFHWRWRWWDPIQAIFLNLFYFMKVTKNQFSFGFVMKKRLKRKGKIWQKTKKVETIWNPTCKWPIDVVEWHMDSPLVALQLFSTTFSTFWNDNLIPNLFLFVFLMSSDLSAFHKHYVVVAKPLQSYAKINEYKNYQWHYVYLFW